MKIAHFRVQPLITPLTPSLLHTGFQFFLGFINSGGSRFFVRHASVYDFRVFPRQWHRQFLTTNHESILSMISTLWSFNKFAFIDLFSFAFWRSDGAAAYPECPVSPAVADFDTHPTTRDDRIGSNFEILVFFT